MVPVYMCGVSFLLSVRRSFVFFLSSCWGWGRLLLSLFWCGCCSFGPGAHAVFRCVSFSGCPSRVLHLTDSGWMAYSCRGRFCGVGGVLVPHLVFYPVPARLPLPLLTLRGFCPLPPSAAYPSRVRQPFRLQLAGLLLRWCLVFRLEGYLLRHLVFYHVPCSSSGACSLRSFPSCRFPWGFQVTGCLSFCFPGDIGWASALPFFSVLLLLRLACRGWLGFAPCVRVLQLRWCLLLG